MARKFQLNNLLARTTITILEIIHRPLFHLKRDILETAVRLRLQVEPSKLCSIGRVILCIRSRFHPKTETESSLRNDVF
jgi:hypothetical protein